MKKLLILTILFFLTGCAPQEGERWYKGNIHTHTIKVDGDTPAKGVINWYFKRGYDFIALTDHDAVPEWSGVKKGWFRKMLVIPGAEVTLNHDVHVGALNLTQNIPEHARLLDPKKLAAIKRQVTEMDVSGVEAEKKIKEIITVTSMRQVAMLVRLAHGIPIVNHPELNFSTLRFVRAIEGVRHFEVWNSVASRQLQIYGPQWAEQHGTTYDGPIINVSSEVLWDQMLDFGYRMYGVAADDAHEFKEKTISYDAAGKAWIVVRASEFSKEAILRAFNDGHFYSSTGVTLAKLDYRNDKTLELQVEPVRDIEGYRIQFIGAGGKILKQTSGTIGSYTLQKGEPFVRAKVIDSNNNFAWTQPLFGPDFVEA